MRLIKYQVYYSSSPNGPWTLANNEPLIEDRIDSNTYTVTNLHEGTTYYFSVIAEREDDNGVYYPIAGQVIGQTLDTTTTPTNFYIAVAKTLSSNLPAPFVSLGIQYQLVPFST